jgi:hypothetical protein
LRRLLSGASCPAEHDDHTYGNVGWETLHDTLSGNRYTKELTENPEAPMTYSSTYDRRISKAEKNSLDNKNRWIGWA